MAQNHELNAKKTIEEKIGDFQFKNMSKAETDFYYSKIKQEINFCKELNLFSNEVEDYYLEYLNNMYQKKINESEVSANADVLKKKIEQNLHSWQRKLEIEKNEKKNTTERGRFGRVHKNDALIK